MGRLALRTHEYVAARRHYEESLALSRQKGEHLACVEALVGLSLAILGRGDREEARRHLLSALQDGLRIGFAPVLLATIAAVAEFLAADGDLIHATQLAVVASDHTASTAETKRLAQKLLTHAKEELSPDTYALAATKLMDSDYLDIAKKLALELSSVDGMPAK